MKKMVLAICAAALVSGCTAAEIRSFASGQPDFLASPQVDDLAQAAEDRTGNRELLERQAAEEKRDRDEQWIRDRREQLQSGELEVSSLNDALILHNPKPGDIIVRAPKASGGDGEYYQVPFRITDRQGDDYVSWWPDVDPMLDRIGTVALDAEVFGDARYHMPMVLIGRYVGNTRVHLVNGSSVTVPVFDDAMLFPHPNATGY